MGVPCFGYLRRFSSLLSGLSKFRVMNVSFFAAAAPVALKMRQCGHLPHKAHMRSIVPILLVTFAVACTAKDSGTTAKTDTTSTTASSSTETAINPTETAVAPEVNSPGDIPDSQAFVKFTNSTGGYQAQVPEGWSQQAAPPEYSSDVTFVHNYDGVSVHIAPASATPTATSVQANEVKQIQSRARAVTISKVSEVNLPGGKAVLISYTSNSDPNAVTNKQVRLENATYIFYKKGKEAMLTMWAPLGADNVDQWNLMADSFSWL